MMTVLHFDALHISRTPRGLTRARHDGGLRSTLIRELKVTTGTHLEHLRGGMCEVERSKWRQLHPWSTPGLKVLTVLHFEYLKALLEVEESWN